MYNGIGLPTPRGSGTNGYVEKNLATKAAKPKDNFAKRHTEAKPIKAVSKDIIEHQRKREIEVKCLELEEKLMDLNYSEGKIQREIDRLRRKLTADLQSPST